LVVYWRSFRFLSLEFLQAIFDVEQGKIFKDRRAIVQNFNEVMLKKSHKKIIYEFRNGLFKSLVRPSNIVHVT